MAGLFHDFILSTEAEINEFVDSFHVNQLDLLYEKIDLFKKEIDTDPETIKGMKIFNRTKEEVLKNCNDLQKVILKAKENNLCIYHYGI